MARVKISASPTNQNNQDAAKVNENNGHYLMDLCVAEAIEIMKGKKNEPSDIKRVSTMSLVASRAILSSRRTLSGNTLSIA